MDRIAKNKRPGGAHAVIGWLPARSGRPSAQPQRGGVVGGFDRIICICILHYAGSCSCVVAREGSILRHP